MRKSANAFLVIGAVWLILSCGCGFFTMFRPGIATRWQQEPAPPEKVIRLELGEAGEVVGYTSDGSTYELSYGSLSTWEKVTQPSGNPVIGMNCRATETTNRFVLSPPNEVLSRVRVDCVMFETAHHLEVALLEDGEIWTWEYGSHAYTELLLFFSLITAFGMGVLVLLIGLGMKIYQKVKAG
ncbi:MAG: hypothetical protein J0L96_19790 [Anaerolineae bacterium]|nr:hypothetical protein [Anaerolineae bacterium]